MKTDLQYSLDDTHFQTTLVEYIKIAKEERFEIILEVPFVGDHTEEKLFVLFNRKDGILLCFDTYGGNKINGGHFYYNWTSNGNWREAYRFISSGILRDLIWSGSHDCRENLRAHLAGLRDHGKFVTPWKVQPFVWLLHYKDTVYCYDYRAINSSRIEKFPDEIKRAIQPA